MSLTLREANSIQCLDEIKLWDFPKLYCENPDEKMHDLLKAINFYGVVLEFYCGKKTELYTVGCCDGESNKPGNQYPWVNIYPYHYPDNVEKSVMLKERVDKIKDRVVRNRVLEEIEMFEVARDFAEMIECFNTTNPIKWRFEGRQLRTVRYARTLAGLNTLQESLFPLAEYVFNAAKGIRDKECANFFEA